MAQANQRQPNPPETANREESWSVKGFVNFAKTVANMVLDLFDVIIEPFFKINPTGRMVRSMLFVIGFMIWWIAAYTSHFPQLADIEPWFTFPPGDNFSTQLMVRTLMLFQQMLQTMVALIAPFFAPDIFRHVLVIGLAAWIAYQWAGIYLDDIFELKDTKISRKFIRRAAFIGPLERVQISDGEIAARHKNSPVIKIGGPGKILVYLENAALFEKINGQPHVILSEDKTVLLEGFERLRTVRNLSPKQPDGHAIFDRRDQFIDEQTIRGRTKDGITVTAKNLSAVFSIHQGPVVTDEPLHPVDDNGKSSIPQIPRRVSLDRDELEEAIRNLVYNQINRPWTDTAKQGIFPAVGIWIGRHTLDEFLANVSPQEFAEIRGRMDETAGQSPMPNVNTIYLSRADLTNAVQGNPEDGIKRGYDVHWVGVGTWETPEEIPLQHKTAFELTVQNRIQGSPLELAQLSRKSRLNELERLMKTVPIATYKHIRRANPKYILEDMETDPLKVVASLENLGLSRRGSFPQSMRSPRFDIDPPQVKHDLMLAYREKLKSARDWYLRNKQTPPEELEAAIKHLSEFQPPS